MTSIDFYIRKYGRDAVEAAITAFGDDQEAGIRHLNRERQRECRARKAEARRERHAGTVRRTAVIALPESVAAAIAQHGRSVRSDVTRRPLLVVIDPGMVDMGEPLGCRHLMRIVYDLRAGQPTAGQVVAAEVCQFADGSARLHIYRAAQYRQPAEQEIEIYPSLVPPVAQPALETMEDWILRNAQEIP